MASHVDIISDIEELVQKYGPDRYGMWIIGVANNPDRIRRQHDGELLKIWDAETPDVARNIHQRFIDNGMAPAMELENVVDARYVYVH